MRQPNRTATSRICALLLATTLAALAAVPTIAHSAPAAPTVSASHAEHVKPEAPPAAGTDPARQSDASNEEPPARRHRIIAPLVILFAAIAFLLLFNTVNT